MKYKLLGRTGVLVSELCFGTMSFGTETDETEAALMFKACRDAGVNFFDCSNNYGGGRAEEILGKLCRGCRNDIVITSKVSQRTGKDINELGASRRHIMQAVERSLARLGSDRIDIYFIHHAEKLGVIAYSPLAAGLLTGKYSQGSQPAAGRIVDKKQYSQRYSDPQYFTTAERFAAFAREIGESPIKLALGWVKSHPAVTAPIIGARNLDQLKASLATADFAMTPDLRERVSRLSVSPPKATDRLEEELDEKFLLRNR